MSRNAIADGLEQHLAHAKRRYLDDPELRDVENIYVTVTPGAMARDPDSSSRGQSAWLYDMEVNVRKSVDGRDEEIRQEDIDDVEIFVQRMIDAVEPTDGNADLTIAGAEWAETTVEEMNEEDLIEAHEYTETVTFTFRKWN